MAEVRTQPATGLRKINLDSAAAARREALGAPDAEVEVEFLGETYRLGVELPLAAVERIASLVDLAGELTALEEISADTLDTLPKSVAARAKALLSDALGEVFCDEEEEPAPDADGHPVHGPDCQWTRFLRGKRRDPQWRGRPSLQDMWVLFSGLVGVYGVSLGESFGPLASWLRSGPLSKLTSGGPGTTPGESSDGAATPS